MHIAKNFVFWVFIGLFSNNLFSQLQSPLPLAIAKRGDVAPGSQLPTGTSDLIFNALSAPSVTENGRRAAFVASLTSGLNNTENRKTIWFADLKENGYYDLKQAAATGMPVQGLTAEDQGKVLNLGTISFSNLNNTRNLPPIALDPEGRNVAFVARLSTPETAEEDSSGESAVFIASDSDIRLVAKENDEFTVTITTDFGSSDESFVPRGFFDLQYINNRLIFLARTRFSGNGVFEYAGGSLNPLFLSPGFSPNAYADPTQGEIRVSRIRTLGLNETGALAYFISGYTKIDAEINGNRDVEAIRFRPSAGQDFVSVAKTWDEFAEYPNRFFSSPAEMSINEAGALLVKANIGVFDEGTPTYPSDSSAIIYYTVNTTGSDSGGVEATSQVLVATGDLAQGVSLEGDAATINHLEAVQVSQDYGSYLAQYTGEEGSFLAYRALYRTRLEEGGPGEPVFYVDRPPNVNGVGTVTGILNYLLGPRGDLIALVTTTDAEALIHVSAPDENGNSTYTLLAESFSNLNFNCEDDCNSFEPRLVALGFIPGGNMLGPVVGPQTGLGGPINKHHAGWMLFDVFSSERNEVVVLFPTGETPKIISASIVSLSPESDANDVPSDSEISVVVYPGTGGIDPIQVIISLDGVQVPSQFEELENGDFRFFYRPSQAFAPGSRPIVQVSLTDKDGNIVEDSWAFEASAQPQPEPDPLETREAALNGNLLWLSIVGGEPPFAYQSSRFLRNWNTEHLSNQRSASLRFEGSRGFYRAMESAGAPRTYATPENGTITVQDRELIVAGSFPSLSGIRGAILTIEDGDTGQSKFRECF